jgi:Fic-DOC domain mobile mystery protein B
MPTARPSTTSRGRSSTAATSGACVPEDDPDGATPLTDDERLGLRAAWVATRADLNIAEQDNIADALTRVRRRRLTVADVLDDQFVRALHQRMFGGVWSWAGTYRATERNIGVDPARIATAVRDLVADAAYWFAPGVTWTTPDEAACRLHHRLVAIHPFPNGNGRHARAYTDLLLVAAGRPPFSWGGGDLQRVTPDRGEYLAALRAADRDPDDLAGLVTFARS